MPFFKRDRRHTKGRRLSPTLSFFYKYADALLSSGGVQEGGKPPYIEPIFCAKIPFSLAQNLAKFEQRFSRHKLRIIAKVMGTYRRREARRSCRAAPGGLRTFRPGICHPFFLDPTKRAGNYHRAFFFALKETSEKLQRNTYRV